MNRNIVLSVFLFYIGISVFFSCSKEESDDNPPAINSISLKQGDIIFTDSSYYLLVDFSDDKGLSSYSIQIRHKDYSQDSLTMVVTEQDTTYTTAYFNRNFQVVNIFDSLAFRDTIRNAFKIDPQLSVNSVRYSVAVGDHYFKLTLVDKGGNTAIDSFLINVARKPQNPE